MIVIYGYSRVRTGPGREWLDSPRTYAFVGSATGMAKLTYSVSGQLLAAWAEQQFGTAVRNATVWHFIGAMRTMR